MVEPERAYFFDTAVQLLSRGFPYTWNKDIGHQFAAWKTCELYVSHIDHLQKQREAYSIQPLNVQGYGELLLSAAW